MLLAERVQANDAMMLLFFCFFFLGQMMVLISSTWDTVLLYYVFWADGYGKVIVGARFQGMTCDFWAKVITVDGRDIDSVCYWAWKIATLHIG